ncbi:hypothetical protein LSTR_LSTR010043 [Laodelphax striatellus]|uniref:BTB domain-containing protein n=1 Tax=Laodelphax striatellus TaxID=195883 RepID=A0A482WP40_LAOST|nr:hypothetical protein LSTR_LSTR010043 [Laodelphax striatellus]
MKGDSQDYDETRFFPFDSTPSGKLKVSPEKVVFESNKMSILLANPQNTMIKLNGEVANKVIATVNSFVLTTDLSELMLENYKMGARGADGDYPIKKENRTTKTKETIDHRKDNDKISVCSAVSQNETSLKRMGCTFDEQINWSKISLPEKSDLHKLLQHRISNSINPDFAVKIGKVEFYCHLLVLECYSSFFENLERNVKSKELPESHVTKDAFRSIYDWMIHPNRDSYQLLRRDNILEIFMAAQYLHVKELEEQCWAFIDNEDLFSEDTAFLLYLDARRLQNVIIMDLMVPRIQRFFLMLVSSRDWLQLQVSEICVFLQSNYICIHCEMEVFMAGVRWLMCDWQARSVHLVEIMRCVRFGLIAPWQLVDIRRNPESPEFLEVTKHHDVAKMVEDGLAFAIIKYWYGHESHEYNHWIDLLGLSEPASRNWAGTEKRYLAYREFLSELNSYRMQPMEGEEAVCPAAPAKKSSSELPSSAAVAAAAAATIPMISDVIAQRGLHLGLPPGAGSHQSKTPNKSGKR